MAEEEHAFVWTALSAPTRRRILDALRAGPMTTGQVVGSLPFSRIATMKHLSVLAEAALIVSRKRGRERWHYLNNVPLQQILERWGAPHELEWAARLVNLRRAVGGPPMSEPPPRDMPRGCPLVIDVQQDITLGAPAPKVFAALTDQIAAWWGPPYVGHAAIGLTLEGRLGGAFQEAWADGGGAILATVTAVVPDRYLELTGRFHMGVSQGVAAFRLEETAGGTALQFSYQAIGNVTDEDVAMYAGGWSQLITVRLKAFVETGQAQDWRHTSGMYSSDAFP